MEYVKVVDRPKLPDISEIIEYMETIDKQIRAESTVGWHHYYEPEKLSKPKMSASERRNFYRKQAGWPPLKGG